MQRFFKYRSLVIYLVKFIGLFCILYYGTLAMIGLAAPGGWHSFFIETYLDYVSWLKLSLIHATAFILSVFQIHTHFEPGYLIRINGGRGVYINMSCVGYGVYSFWIAFVAANSGSMIRKTIWIIGGLLALWLINVIRITLFLVAINRGWGLPFGIDHHTWFTIAAYIMIFILIIFYDRSSGIRMLRS